LEHLHAPATADLAFDAEVGIEEPPPAPAAQPWWHPTMNGLGGKIGDGVEGVNGLQDAFAVRHLKFTELESGKISVHADTPPGTRWAYRQLVLEKGFDFRGTRYNPKTVASLTAKGLWEGAKKDVPLAGVLAFGENLWTFGTDPSKGATFWDRTVKNREFWVSTVVDFGISVAVGFVAAAIVAAASAGLTVALGFTVPLWLAVGATAILSVGIGMWIDAKGYPEMVKTWLNRLLSQKQR